LIDSLLDAFQLEATVVQTARDRVEMHGGDLFGQLLVMGAVSEAELIEQLSELTGLNGADPSTYSRIGRDAFATLGDQVLREHAIIPFRKHRRSVAVFVVEPLDSETLDALSEDHGVAISQFIWPRLRYEQALHSLLGEPLAEWLEPFLAQSSHQVSFVEDPATAQPQGSEESSGAIDLNELGVNWSRAATLDFLRNCFDRDALLYTLLGFSAKWLDDRMVIVLGHERAQPYLIAGWDGLSDDLREHETLRRVKIEVPADAVLFDEDQIGHSTAEKPEDVGLGQLFVELTLFPPDRLLVQTVRIGSRPSMAVIGEPRDGKLEAVESLEEVAREVGSQLEEIVRRAKSQQLPPPDERIPAIPSPAGDDTPVGDDAEEEDRPAVPGLAEVSASEPRDEPDTPGATAFGIPFADEAGDDATQRQKRSAVEISSPGVAEDSSVSIIAPVDIDEDSDEVQDSDHSEANATISGGFSVAEFQQGLKPDGPRSTAVLDAVDEQEKNADAEPSEMSEASEPADASKAQAPMAQILRPVSLKRGRKKSGVVSSADAEPKQETPDPEPVAEELAAEESAAQNSDEPAGEQDLYVDRADIDVEGLPSIEIEEAVDSEEPAEEPDEPEDLFESSASSEASELGDQSSSFDDDLEAMAMKLDNAEPHASFAAAEQLAAFGEPAMKLLEERFPGRLLVDRYQYTDDTMPPVSEHGPVLAALAAAGSHAVAVVRSFLSHTSVELRFYATYLFTSLPVADVLEELAPRLFDRDYQTREVAKTIVLSHTDPTWLEQQLVPSLRDAIESGQEDLRIEVAADILGAIRDQDAVPLLIDGLNRANGRVKEHVHAALRKITYKSFVPSASEWKNWWVDAQEQTRDDWLVAALNSSSIEIRNLVVEELDTFEGLKLDYHPDQPAKLRGRAQEELRRWLQQS
jgi:hypothetical protein